MGLKMHMLSGPYNGLEAKIRFIFRSYPKALLDPRLRKVTEGLAGKGTRYEQAGNLYDGLKESVLYMADPVGVEMTKSPSRMLDDLQRGGHLIGDCDDLASFAYTALMSIGVPAGLRVVWKGNKPMPCHIYAFAILNGVRVPFDLASKSKGFGEETDYTRREDYL